jgi:hypothetical protein
LLFGDFCLGLGLKLPAVLDVIHANRMSVWETQPTGYARRLARCADMDLIILARYPGINSGATYMPPLSGL